jgi:signal transduction histidine kinase
MTRFAHAWRRSVPANKTLVDRYLASTRWRLAASYAVLIALLLVAIVAATYIDARIQETTQIHGQLMDKANEKLKAPDLPQILRQSPQLKDEEEDVRTFVVSRDGVVRDADAVARHPPDRAAVARILTGGKAEFTTIVSPGSNLSVYTAPIYRHGSIVGAIQAITSVRPYEVILHNLLRISLVLGSVGIILAAAIGSVMANWGLHPVRRAITRQQVFAQDAAHELRAPLTVVRVAADLALRSDNLNEMREALTTTVRQTEHLEAVVRDLRLLAQGDVGRLIIEPAPLDLTALVRDVCEEVQPSAAARGIDLQLDAPGALTIAGDQYRLRQLLLILIDNALKYTDTGGTVTVHLSQPHGNVILTVRDTGAGIETRHLPHIFDRLYRAKPAEPGQLGGAGLGLAIGREIVGAHRGQISVQSEVGRGTTFRVALPHDTTSGGEATR